MAVKLGNGNWAVKEDKLLAYNDNSGLFFNKEFDFSRGTSATYVAKDGLIKTAGIQPNIVTNGTFDTDSDWGKYVAGDSNSITIANGVLSFNSNTNQNVFQTISSSNLNGFYKLTYTITSYTRGNAYFLLGGGSNIYLGSTVGTHTKYVQGGGSNANLIIYGGIFGQGGELSIDNVTVQEIQTDTPRIDFTNDTKGHLLLEPSRTNLITYSQDFSQSSWVKLGAGTGTTAIVTSDYAISPDGTQNASRLQCDLNGGGSSSSNQSLIYNLYSSSGSQALSIYMKSNNGENQTIYFANTQTSGDTVTVTSEWQRFTFTHSTSTYVLAVGLRGRSGGAINDTADILIWGAQAEAGDYSTSLIYSTGAASTRNADVCNNSGSAQDFNSEEGVLYAEIASLASDGTYREMSLSDNTLNTRVVFSYTSTPNRIRGNVKIASSSTAFNLFYTTTDETDFIKVAVKFKSGDYALWVNGVERATNTTSDIFAVNELTHLNFTSGAGSSSPMFGKIRNVQVFTEALTDEQLEKLTS